MSDVSDLMTRLEKAVNAVKEKAQKAQQEELKHYQERQRLLKDYEAVQAKIIEEAKPRLSAFAERMGKRVSVTPVVSETRRAARFEFRSSRAYITLTISVAPDQEIKNVALEYDLKVVPVLWTFNSHAQFRTSIATPDLAGMTNWLDDHLVEFVELYLRIHEVELYEKTEYVEDPIAKVTFPKFAAGATLEHGGTTYYFMDDVTRAEFVRQNKLG